MRINQFLAKNTSLSRRSADDAIKNGRVKIDDQPAQLSDQITDQKVYLDGQLVQPNAQTTTIILNKPVGYVCSRNGQGSKTVYDLLPKELHNLNPVGRLDKDSSGLLLMTNDGVLANELTHPRYSKQKIYEINLDKPLQPLHQQMINDHGIMLEDGNSKLILEKLNDQATKYRVTMNEGRNRQIRRTFSALGYKVTHLHRTHFGQYVLSGVAESKIRII